MTQKAGPQNYAFHVARCIRTTREGIAVTLEELRHIGMDFSLQNSFPYVSLLVISIPRAVFGQIGDVDIQVLVCKHFKDAGLYGSHRLVVTSTALGTGSNTGANVR